MGPNVWPVREGGNGGNGGKSWDGADGGQSHYETKYAQVTAAGGSGARGGQGGNGGSTANTSYVPKDLEFDKIIAGQAGGNHGSGNHGGGDGGAPVKFERRRSVKGDGHIDDYIALSSAAGGGGYAGGGSGALVVISRDPILKWAASDVPGQLGGHWCRRRWQQLPRTQPGRWFQRDRGDQLPRHWWRAHQWHSAHGTQSAEELRQARKRHDQFLGPRGHVFKTQGLHRQVLRHSRIPS